MSSSNYWILQKPDLLADEIAERVGSFQDKMQITNMVSVWAKNRAFYENRIISNSISDDIVDAGDVGELKGATFNHYRNILRHIINGIAANMPAFDVSAINSSKSSRRAASIGRDLVTYYYKTIRLQKYLKRTLERSVVYGASYIAAEFDPTIGREMAVSESGKIIREGDWSFDSLSPFDVFYDYSKKDTESWSWVTWRKAKNKYDIAILFPKQKDKLLGLKSCAIEDKYADHLRMIDKDQETDDIWLYSTYHKATPAVPKGKYVLTAGSSNDSILLYESDNPYRENLPIFELYPATYLETCFGFSEANILRSPQMILTTALSYLLSNMEMGGINSIWTPRGAGLTVEQLEGMSLIQSDVKPEVLNFFKESSGLLEMVNLCSSAMETLSAQNAAMRGNIKEAPNLKSGIAIATVINQAQQYGQSLEDSYHELFERVFTFILKHLQKVATEERMYEISGKGKKSAISSYKKDDIEGINRVYIDQVNPITKSPAGKIEVAMELLKVGQITPEQFFDVVNTGNLEVAVESDQMMFDYIAACKEALLSGKKVIPIPGVNHRLFIQEIQSLLYDYDLTTDEKNSEILENIITLVNGHMDLIRNGDEIAALIYGGQPPTPPQMSNSELNPEALSALAQPEQAMQAGVAGPGQPARPQPMQQGPSVG